MVMLPGLCVVQAPEEVYGKKKGKDGILRDASELDQDDRKRLRRSDNHRKEGIQAAGQRAVGLGGVAELVGYAVCSCRDKKAARRKERRQKAAVEKLVERVKPGLGNKYSKQKLREELRQSGKVVEGRDEGEAAKGLGKSSKFFKRLQEEVTQHGGGYAKTKARADDDKSKGPGSSALKL